MRMMETASHGKKNKDKTIGDLYCPLLRWGEGCNYRERLVEGGRGSRTAGDGKRTKK